MPANVSVSRNGEMVVKLILYITGRKEGRKRNGCRTRTHLSVVNAHARTEHYFGPRPEAETVAMRKKEREKYPVSDPFSNRFAHRARTPIVGQFDERERLYNVRGEAVFPTFTVFRTRRYCKGRIL